MHNFLTKLLHLSPSNYNQTAGMKLIENYNNMEERFAVFSGQTEDMLVFKVAIVDVVRLRAGCQNPLTPPPPSAPLPWPLCSPVVTTHS